MGGTHGKIMDTYRWLYSSSFQSVGLSRAHEAGGTKTVTNITKVLVKDLHLRGPAIQDGTVEDLRHHRSLLGCLYVRSIRDGEHTKQVTYEREYRKVATETFLSNFKLLCRVAMGL